MVGGEWCSHLVAYRGRTSERGIEEAETTSSRPNEKNAEGWSREAGMASHGGASSSLHSSSGFGCISFFHANEQREPEGIIGGGRRRGG